MVPKKVSESVSKKFGTEKSLGIIIINNANTNRSKKTVQRSGANAVQGNGVFPAPVLSLFSFLVQFTVFRFTEGLQSYTIKSMH